MIEINDEKRVNIKNDSNNENKNIFSLNDEEILLIINELIIYFASKTYNYL